MKSVALYSFHFLENTNCTINGLSHLDPKMPSHLYIAEQQNSMALKKAAVLCTENKILDTNNLTYGLSAVTNATNVTSTGLNAKIPTFEDGIFYLHCDDSNKSWTQPAVWPKCIKSDKTCATSALPTPPAYIGNIT